MFKLMQETIINHKGNKGARRRSKKVFSSCSFVVKALAFPVFMVEPKLYPI
jgi:hypothetical protein